MDDSVFSDQRLRVFLCHSSGDKAQVKQLYDRLVNDGVAPWLDSEYLRAAVRWDDKIKEAIEQSDLAAICLSQEAVKKRGYFQREINYILEVVQDVPPDTPFVIPLKLEPVELPKKLRPWQWAELYAPDGYDSLMRALTEHARALGRVPPTYEFQARSSTPAPQPPQSPDAPQGVAPLPGTTLPETAQAETSGAGLRHILLSLASGARLRYALLSLVGAALSLMLFMRADSVASSILAVGALLVVALVGVIGLIAPDRLARQRAPWITWSAATLLLTTLTIALGALNGYLAWSADLADPALAQATATAALSSTAVSEASVAPALTETAQLPEPAPSLTPILSGPAPRLTPILPERLLVLANLAECGATTIDAELRQAVTSEMLGGRDFSIQTRGGTSDQLVAAARDERALVAIWAECDQNELRSATLSFIAPPALPINLLQEPAAATLQPGRPPSDVLQFVQAGMLYSLGQYAAAQHWVETMSRDGQPDLGLLQGNIALRLERWDAAAQAYQDALRELAATPEPSSPETTAQRANLQANRSLASLLAQLAVQSEQTFADCQQDGLSAIEAALPLVESQPNQAALEVLYGTVLLNCAPDADGKNPQEVLERAERVLKELAPGYGPAYLLKAQALESKLGAPAEIERLACLALAHTAPSLPEAHELLANLYKYYRLPEAAREQIRRFSESAPFIWQQAVAASLLEDVENGVDPAPAGLKGHCP